MPLIKSAIKKMRQDARKRIVNKKLRFELKKIIKEAEAKPNTDLVQKAYSILDKAVKRGLVHKNTSNRNKSSLAKKLKTASKRTQKNPTKKS